MKVYERPRDKDNKQQHTAQIDVGPVILVKSEGDEAQYATGNKKQGKEIGELLSILEPLWFASGGRQSVVAVLCPLLLDLLA